MSYNSNSSSNESNNNMEINSNNNKSNEEQIEMNNTNSNNNISMDGGNTSSSSYSKHTNKSPCISKITSSSSLSNSAKSSSPSSSDENNRKTNTESSTDNNNPNRRDTFSSNNEDDEEEEEDEEEDNTQYNSSNQSDEYRGEAGRSDRSSGNSNDSNRAIINTDQELTSHSVSAYERLTKSVRSFLNATRILRTQFTAGSPESSAAEESSSSNNQAASLSPYSSTSSGSPPSSSSPSQSGLSPPSMSSSNQSHFSSNQHRHHHYHHHHASSSNSDKVKNMTKKSNLFDELLKQCSDNSSTGSSKKSNLKVNKTNLKNLCNILKNNENYYTTMFFPITDNYKLESAKQRYTFRNNMGRLSRRSSKKDSSDVKSNGEDSNGLNELEIAYKQQNQETTDTKTDKSNNNNDNNNNNSNDNNSCATNSNNTSSSNNSSPNTCSNSSNSNNNSNNNSTNIKLKSSEFFICPLCCHCLYEPITLICGCSFCKSCLNEFNLTSIKLSLIKLAKKNAADNLNSLDLFTNTDCKMSKACTNNNDNSNQGSSSRKGCQSDDENDSVSSSDDSSSNNNSNISSDSSLKGLSCRNLGLFKCYNCSKTHEFNTAEYLKANTNIACIVEKLFQSKIEVRKLRNDIRRYIIINLENNSNTNNKTKHFDLDKYEKMLLHAYNMDKTNHLLLADLFMINYFSGRLDKALEYAKKTTELRPKWAFSYFMKSVYYQKNGDLNNLRTNLIQSFQLDSSIEQIRFKIFQINYIILKPIHSQITDGKSAINYLKNKHKALKKTENQSLDLYAIKRSFSFHNSQEANMAENDCLSKYPKHSSVVSKKRYHSSDTDGKTFNPNNINYQFKSGESLNADENETNETNEQSKQLNININLINPNDLECSLCYRLFYNPVTTPCGHSYCCSCLERSLDYQDKCPLCKNSLAEYLAERRQSPTYFLDSLIKGYFSKEYDSRKKQYLDELKELTNNENEIPVFVCTTALPFASCPLHIYEPRYRLMLRRAIESGSKQFGMCMYSEMTPYHYTEYGCMLEIRNYQFTRDGRAVVATVGGRRFKVIRAYMKDGYNVAQIEWVNDIREENENIPELQTLHDKTYQLALKWYRLIPEIQKQKILEIYGEMPQPEIDIQANDNGPVWHWFLLNILPLENDFQYKFLTKTSLKERLKQIKKLLIFMLLIDRSRQQMTSSTSSQNIYSLQDGDIDSSANYSGRSRSSNEIDSNQQQN